MTIKSNTQNHNKEVLVATIGNDDNSAAKGGNGFTFFNVESLGNDHLSNQDVEIQGLLGNLITERMEWETNEYARSNERLYSILTDCYGLFKSLTGATKHALSARNSFKRIIKSWGYQFSDSTHLMVQVVRVVFGSESRRTNRYANALKIASAQGILVKDLKDFLYQSGGVEEVCRQKKNAPLLARHEKGQAIHTRPAITTIVDSNLSDAFNIDDYDTAVLFMATYDELNDSFDVLSVIQNISVLKAAYASLASDITEDEFKCHTSSSFVPVAAAQCTADVVNADLG